MLQVIATPSEKEIILKSLNIWASGLASLLLISSVVASRPAFADLHVKTYLDREIECLAKNIYHEAGGESREGKIAVAQVTVNRAEDTRYPSTICGVISHSAVFNNKIVCQFSWYCNKRSAKLDPELYAESVEVAEQVLLDGVRLAKIKDALYFHAAKINPRWRKIRVAKIGNHIFYRDV